MGPKQSAGARGVAAGAARTRSGISRRRIDTARRQWIVYEALRSRARGLTIPQLVEATGIPRSTVYRYIHVFEQAGVPLATDRVNGEARHRLMEAALPAFALERDELAALALARELLRPFDGTRVVEQLDALLRRLSLARVPRAPSWLSIGGPAAESDRGALRAIDLAIRDGHRLAFDYRAADDDAPERRVVDPVSVRLHRGQPYLIAFDVKRADWRTFKLARIAGGLELAGEAAPHSDFDEAKLFAHSAGIWTGDVVDVAVRLAAEVAPRAAEWPLASNQVAEAREDGSVVVRAKVAGIAEPLRWVLSWGAAAEAMEPDELREAVRAELSGALRGYAGAAVEDDGEGEGEGEVVSGGMGRRAGKARRGS